MLKDGHILWALRSIAAGGNSDAAYDLLVQMSNASEGILIPCSPNTKLEGAVNRNAVTCFLDATLFSLFTRLDSFEAMLYNSFEDTPRERLAFLLRLWVNMLRSGNLITVDITREIQESLAQCGWDDARELHQQDASEAFTFITERLNLPLLTLKMDIYHTGKQDSDDHKFINERLLEVGIPTMESGEYPKEIKLEDCLEEYFNNRIEVKRYLERRNTLQSTKSQDSKAKEMGLSVHVETVELDEPSTPVTPPSSIPSYISERPPNRHRAASIIQERYIPEQSDTAGSPMDKSRAPLGRMRQGSVRKEVLMPAWQFFSLIPWYTDNAPSNDAQVAAHFSSKRPVLGLCLKRYFYTNHGRAMRLDTIVDIPIEIGLPHFIQDDVIADDAPIYGNFKLSLQSVVCHRGISVDSGHYISLARMQSTTGSEGETSTWLRFDDLASPRVSLVDIHKALKEETPYLLFYQILPVEGDPGNLTVGEESAPAYTAPQASKSTVGTMDDPLVAVGSIEEDTASGAPSTDATPNGDPRGRSSQHDSSRRPSTVSFTDYLPQQPRKSAELISEQTPVLEHRKSASFSKTFSKLGMTKTKKGSKEDLSAQEKPTGNSDGGPQIYIERIASSEPDVDATFAAARDKNETRPISGTAPISVPVASPAGGLGPSRGKREKSRSRKLKGKLDDPDRECVVM